MNYRKTKLYKKLDSYMACAIAEGFGEGEGASRKDQLIAWQYLIDTGLCWSLQGWFGRTAYEMVQQGLIKKPVEKQKDYYGNTVKY